MLLNEFLKEYREVEDQAQKGREQDATIAQLKSAVARQQSANAATTGGNSGPHSVLKAQAAQIQKVYDQLRTQVPAPRVVANN